MSRAAFDQVIERARTDESFRSRLRCDAVRALAVYELTREEFFRLRVATPGADVSGLDEQPTPGAAVAAR
jgi:hypothetical protein